LRPEFVEKGKMSELAHPSGVREKIRSSSVGLTRRKGAKETTPLHRTRYPLYREGRVGNSEGKGTSLGRVKEEKKGRLIAPQDFVKRENRVQFP